MLLIKKKQSLQKLYSNSPLHQHEPHFIRCSSQTTYLMLLFTICQSHLLCQLTLSICSIKKCLHGTRCIMPCMYNDIICGPHSFVTGNLLYLHRSEQGNSGRMYYNECQSRVLRGILFLVLLRNMDYEWGRDQTCCGFNMYASFHMHHAHSRCEPASASDTGEKEPDASGLLVVCWVR